jgi:hypothetical protein
MNKLKNKNRKTNNQRNNVLGIFPDFLVALAYMDHSATPR